MVINRINIYKISCFLNILSKNTIISIYVLDKCIKKLIYL